MQSKIEKPLARAVFLFWVSKFEGFYVSSRLAVLLRNVFLSQNK